MASSDSRGFWSWTRTSAWSSMYPLSSPCLQQTPLQSAQAARATTPVKPTGSGATADAVGFIGPAFLRSRMRSIRCCLSRLIRSGETGASRLSLRGTMTGRLSCSGFLRVIYVHGSLAAPGRFGYAQCTDFHPPSGRISITPIPENVRHIYRTTAVFYDRPLDDTVMQITALH